MAYFWTFSVECSTHEETEAVRVHFDGTVLPIPTVRAVAHAYEDEDGHKCDVHPTPDGDTFPLWASGGPGSAAEAVEMTAVGRALYERLRTSPPFRFALCGVEAGSWDSYDGLKGHLPFGSAYHGLVLSAATWESLGRPEPFEAFSEGCVWIPWKGEPFSRNG